MKEATIKITGATATGKSTLLKIITKVITDSNLFEITTAEEKDSFCKITTTRKE